MLSLYYTQEQNHEQYRVNFSRDAAQAITYFEEYIKNYYIPNCPASAIPALQKLHGQAARLAWGFHAWNCEIPHEHEITADEVTMAVTICHDLIPHIFYLYSGIGLQAYKDAKKVLSCMQGVLFSPYDRVEDIHFKSRFLQQRTHLKSNAVLNALRLLEIHNVIRIIDTTELSYIIVPHPYIRNFRID